MCGCGSICGDDHTARPWWPTEQRWDISPDEKVLTDCCVRRVPARETVCQLRTQEIPLGDYGDYHERDPWPSKAKNGRKYRRRVNWFSYASYYDPTWTVRCNPDGGCNANARLKFGATNRANWLEAA